MPISTAQKVAQDLLRYDSVRIELVNVYTILEFKDSQLKKMDSINIVQTEKINSLDLIFVNLNKVIDILRRNFEIFSQLTFLRRPRAKVRVSKYINNSVIPNIFEFNKVCAQSNLKFLAILQPSLFSNINTDTATVEELNHLPKFVPNFLEMANNLFVKSFRDHGFFADARHMFKDAIKPVYCDWVHTTEFGNLKISEYIFKEISNRNWIKPLES